MMVTRHFCQGRPHPHSVSPIDFFQARTLLLDQYCLGPGATSFRCYPHQISACWVATGWVFRSVRRAPCTSKVDGLCKRGVHAVPIYYQCTEHMRARLSSTGKTGKDARGCGAPHHASLPAPVFRDVGHLKLYYDFLRSWVGVRVSREKLPNVLVVIDQSIMYGRGWIFPRLSGTRICCTIHRTMYMYCPI